MSSRRAISRSLLAISVGHENVASADPAVGRGILEILAEVRGVHEQFLRHAAADHAGASRPVGLGDRDARAEARRDAGRTHSARAGADHEQVVVELRHRRSTRAQASTPSVVSSRRAPASIWSIISVEAVGLAEVRVGHFAITEEQLDAHRVARGPTLPRAGAGCRGPSRGSGRCRRNPPSRISRQRNAPRS